MHVTFDPASDGHRSRFPGLMYCITDGPTSPSSSQQVPGLSNSLNQRIPWAETRWDRQFNWAYSAGCFPLKTYLVLPSYLTEKKSDMSSFTGRAWSLIKKWCLSHGDEGLTWHFNLRTLLASAWERHENKWHPRLFTGRGSSRWIIIFMKVQFPWKSWWQPICTYPLQQWHQRHRADEEEFKYTLD